MRSNLLKILDTLLALSLVAGAIQAVAFVWSYKWMLVDAVGVLVLYEVLVVLVAIFIVRLLHYDLQDEIEHAHRMTRYLAGLLISSFGLEMLLNADTPMAFDFAFQFTCVICYQMATDPALDRNSPDAMFKGFIPLNFYNLFWIFIICSVVGLIGETIVSAVIDGKWESRAGFVWGPFSPIYGIGGVLVTVALNRMHDKNPVLLFALSALVGMGFEGFAGWFWKSSFGIVAWDYSGMLGSIFGYTCLEIGLVWGAVGIIWVKLALPFMMRATDAIPMRARIPLTLAFGVFILADAALTLGSFNFWFERKAGIQDDSAQAQFFETYFGDKFMERRFETMSMFTNLAKW